MLRIGVDLGGTKIEAACVADDGEIVLRRRVPTPRDDYEATIAAIAQLVGDLLPAPPVSQRNGYSPLCIILTDDEFIKFRDSFSGGERVH